MIHSSVLEDASKNEVASEVPVTYKRTGSETKSKLMQAAQQFLNSGDIDVSRIEGDALNEIPTIKAPPAVSTEESKVGNQPNSQPERFKTLRDALDVANRQIEDLRGRTEKWKDYDDVAAKKAELELKLKDIEPKYNELEEWKSRYGLLRSDEYHSRFQQPRSQIEASIKQELEADGLDISVWREAQGTNSRRELEMVVNSHIDSDLLKQQFYNLFFQDFELRKQEAAALSAPTTYMQRLQQEESDKRATLKDQFVQNQQEVWEDALKDADDMSNKLGQNKIAEISMITGNHDHNEKIVKPILKAAHEAAEAELKERIENNLPITRDIAARTVYKWRQAVAAQAANRDRLKWFREAQNNAAELKKLQDKYNNLLSKGSPTPGSTSSVSNGGGQDPFKGETRLERFKNLADSVKQGS